MSTGAIVMLVISLIVLWGGLILAVINLFRRGQPPTDLSHRDL